LEKRNYPFSIEVYRDRQELGKKDALLLEKAQKAISAAHAPYSGFRVGAAARLANGEFVSGSNQENASSPAGICAERVLLSAVSSVYPGVPIECIAITYQPERGEGNGPIAPCGICRQSLAEYEQRNGAPIRLILGGHRGEVFATDNVISLLPLAFTATALD
jgi:cytidine deaminase